MSPTLEEDLGNSRFLYLFNKFLFFYNCKKIYKHDVHTLLHKLKKMKSLSQIMLTEHEQFSK